MKVGWTEIHKHSSLILSQLLQDQNSLNVPSNQAEISQLLLLRGLAKSF